jgi:hypothetical protein
MATNPIDLCTVADVDGWLNQPGIDATLIQTAITRYSANVLKRTGRAFLGGIRTYNERYNGQGWSSLQLKNYPIQTVSSLTVNGLTVPATPDYIQTGYAINPEGEYSSLVIVGNNGRKGQGEWPDYAFQISGMAPYAFWPGILNVAVTYQAGYLLQALSEAATVPATPGPYTVNAANASTWFADLGATNSAGSSLAGQYSVAAGVYTFSPSLQGTAVLLNYSYGGVPLDLQQAATQLVAQQYRRRQWIDQTQVNQPQVGTTSYSRLEMELGISGTIDRYTARFLT